MLTVTFLIAMAALSAAQADRQTCAERAENQKTLCTKTCESRAASRQETCVDRCATQAASVQEVCERFQDAAEKARMRFDQAKEDVEKKSADLRQRFEDAAANGGFKATCTTTICTLFRDAERKAACEAKCDMGAGMSPEEARAKFAAAAEEARAALRERFNAAKEENAEKREEARAKLAEAIEVRRGAMAEKKAELAKKFDEWKAKATAAAEGRREEINVMKGLIEQFKAAETEEDKKAIKDQISAAREENEAARKEIIDTLKGKREELAKKIFSNNEERRESLKLIIAEFKGAAAERKAEILAKLREIAPDAEVESEDDRRRSSTVVAMVPCDDDLCVLEATTVFAEVADDEDQVTITEVNAQDIDSEAQEAEISDIVDAVAPAGARKPVMVDITPAVVEEDPKGNDAPAKAPVNDVDGSASSIVVSAVAVVCAALNL